MKLRPMTMEDADFMLELKNYPETREFAIASKEEIKREDHIKWLENNLQFFQVLEASHFSGNAKIGAIRIHSGNTKIGAAKIGAIRIHSGNTKIGAAKIGAIRIQDDEISIWIDRHHWGNGIATYILNQVAKPGMIAKIVDGNIASMRAFINAGFKPFNHINVGSVPFYTFKR